MGIKDLSKILSEDDHGIYQLADFQGKIFALDGGSLIYKMLFRAISHVLQHTSLLIEAPDRSKVFAKTLHLLLGYIEEIYSVGILPVMVMDGIHHPEKSETIQERSTRKQKVKERLAELRNQIDQYDDALEVPNKLMMEYRTNIQSDLTPVTADYQNIELVLRCLGVPVLKAPHDAEELCCWLNREGLVDVVISTDSDVLAYGCELWYKLEVKDNRRSRGEFIGIYLSDILKRLKLDHDEFLDLCIALGTDFNQRMRGYGPKKCQTLINQHRRIDQFPKKIDTTCLRANICRDLFRRPLDVEVSLVPEFDPSAHDIVSPYGVPTEVTTRFSQYCHNWLKSPERTQK